MVDEFDVYRRFDLSALKCERQRAHSRSIFEGVFDDETLRGLYHLYRKGVLTGLGGVFSTGKEAHLFYGWRGDDIVAVKIYMFETSDFRNMARYVRGDPRFGGWRNRRQLVHMWAQKEFKNLSRVCERVRCPKPLEQHKNILVMEYIGGVGSPAPKLREAQVDNPEKCFDRVIDYIGLMRGERLVHSDLSEYNILVDGSEPVIIDFATGVLLEHPMAAEFFERDVANVVSYFRRLGVDCDYHDTLMGLLK
jgi:RIO kinase 1